MKAVSVSPRRVPVPRKAGFHITQRRDPIHNPDGLENSENCGPTSLAMSLAHLDLTPPGYDQGDSVQSLIDASRFAMFSDEYGFSVDTSKDGVTYSASTSLRYRNDEEHMTLTNLEDVERGAENSGASSARLSSLEEVNDALSESRPVMLAGNPACDGAYGQRFDMDYDGGHFILVTGFDEDTENYRLSDPLLSDGSAVVSQDELTSFLSANIFEDTVGLAFSKA